MKRSLLTFHNFLLYRLGYIIITGVLEGVALVFPYDKFAGRLDGKILLKASLIDVQKASVFIALYDLG